MDTSLAQFKYVLRVYDELNEIHKDIVIELNDAKVNNGPTVEVLGFDSEKQYGKGDVIPLKFNIQSELNLPLEVKLYVQHNGKGYKESYNLTLGEDGYYSYDYETFIESELQFKLVVNDTDLTETIELDPISVGKPIDDSNNNNNNNNNNNGGGGMSCSMGASIILPLVGAFGILILKKREN